jgi:hypothetical protein
MRISRSRALALLTLCQGDEIWSLEDCRVHGVPEVWIEDLSDTFESGFSTDRQTIYVGDRVTNHYHGVRDLDLAERLAESLGLDFDRITANLLNKRSMVVALKQAVFEGD